MGFAHALQHLWPFRGPPDGRSECEIDDDLDAEFAFHLEEAARDLTHEGHAPEIACLVAKERFGDLERYKLQCRRIALKERIMLQRVNFILMIVVTLVMIGVGAQVWITQRHNTLALMDINAQIAKMRMDAAAEAPDPAWGGPADGSGATTAKVLVEGAVDKPGWYDVTTANGATLLHELMQLAGVQSPQSRVLYTRSGDTRSRSYHFDELQSETNKVVLGPGDRIRVAVLSAQELAAESMADPPYASSAELESGEYRQFDVASGKEVGSGARLLLLGVGDIRNITDSAGGVAVLPGETAEIGLMFNGVNSKPTNLHLFDDQAKWVKSRWQLDEHGNLILNLAPLRPGLSQPLVLRRVGSGDDQLNALGDIIARMRQGEFGRSVAADTNPHADASPESQPVADPLKRSPFRAVKWTDWTPIVDVQGQWYELIAVDTIPVIVLIEQAKKIGGADPRSSMSENLLMLLKESGRTVGDSLRLDVLDIASGTKLAINQAALTAENFQRVKKSNEESKAAGEEYPRYVASNP